jgi:FMN-dependent NADH-azoreductase
MNILLVTSSPRGAASVSTRVARELAKELAHTHPGATLTERDLSREPVPFITEEFVRAMQLPAETRTDAERRALALSDTLIAELQQADAVVIGSAMINFSIPAPLKAWLDQVTRAGLTFSYASGAPEGLLQGKKTYLVLASGGVYSDGPAAAMDFQRPYLLAMLGFLGLTDVEVVLAEGTVMDPEVGERALGLALERLAGRGSLAEPSGRALAGV